ncbi:hypothetical protein GGQ85_002156 [Nitrobacter vulgaris]|nr:hypothetical protein [Nitrobacter vulgaris]
MPNPASPVRQANQLTIAIGWLQIRIQTPEPCLSPTDKH